LADTILCDRLRIASELEADFGLEPATPTTDRSIASEALAGVVAD
jgi:hypothetical protein